MAGTLSGTWRDLKCVCCDEITGFTNAKLKEIMSPNYEMNYWCAKCARHTVQVFTGATFEYVEVERVYTQLVYDNER